jgi:serine carboxypeptidase 1
MGFAMGNSWISPIDSTLTWGPLLYWMSLVDAEGERLIQEEGAKAQAAIAAGDWELATDYWASTEYVVINQTNGVDFYNILKFVDYFSSIRNVHELKLGLKRRLPSNLYKKIFLPSSKAVDPLDTLMNGIIKEQLGIIPDHVTWGGQSDAVFTFQEGDFMKPVVDVVDSALRETGLQVIVYQGQLDLICDTKGTMDWVQQLTWDQLGNYNGAIRRALTKATDGQTEIFVKAFNRFKFYWVLGGGHAIAADVGDTAYRMFERILANVDT